MVAFEENGQGYFTFEEVITNPIVEKFINRFHENDRKLISELLYSTLNKHYSCWESDERKQQHSLYNIEKLEWNKKESCIHVYFKKTETFNSTWYHYTLNGEWY